MTVGFIKPAQSKSAQLTACMRASVRMHFAHRPCEMDELMAMANEYKLARPAQLAEALESVAIQDRSLLGEILIGDDSPRRYRDENRAVIAASGLADSSSKALGHFVTRSLGGQYPLAQVCP